MLLWTDYLNVHDNPPMACVCFPLLMKFTFDHSISSYTYFMIYPNTFSLAISFNLY